jgi:hypothetical protein
VSHVPEDHNTFVGLYGFTLSKADYRYASPREVRAAIARGVRTWSDVYPQVTREQRRTIVGALYTDEWLKPRSQCVLGAVTRDASSDAVPYFIEMSGLK